jgi:hypothetical protein
MVTTFLPFSVVSPVVAVPVLDDAAPVNDPLDLQLFTVDPVFESVDVSEASNQRRVLGIMLGLNEVAAVRPHLVER